MPSSIWISSTYVFPKKWILGRNELTRHFAHISLVQTRREAVWKESCFRYTDDTYISRRRRKKDMQNNAVFEKVKNIKLYARAPAWFEALRFCLYLSKTGIGFLFSMTMVGGLWGCGSFIFDWGELDKWRWWQVEKAGQLSQNMCVHGSAEDLYKVERYAETECRFHGVVPPNVHSGPQARETETSLSTKRKKSLVLNWPSPAVLARLFSLSTAHRALNLGRAPTKRPT